MIRINNTQYSHFLQQADALRRSGSLCDATISVKSHTFRAHRLVLACASRRLAQQLSREDARSSCHCTLEYFSPRTFQQVLDFTYAQELEVTVDDLYLLLRAARLLEMQLLADQCQQQLDSLSIGERETKHDKEEEEEGKETIEVEESAGENLSSPSLEKKPRVSPTCPVISRPVSTSAPVHPPWTFTANMWGSVTTLRKIAQNYSTFFGTHPLPNLNPSSVAYPFSLSSANVLPLLTPHFPSPLHRAYADFYPDYTPSRSPGRGSILKHAASRRRKHGQKPSAQSVEQSHHQADKPNMETMNECQHCSSSVTGDTTPPESASSLPGEVCAVSCRFCRRGQGEPQAKPPDHRGEKPYHCQHCPKRFSLKHQLDTHHRVHTGEKPFECRLCGQRSRDYSAMIKHLRTHGGAAPYQCTVCLEFCSSLAAMQRHVKGHALHDFPPDWSINSTYLYNSHL